MTVRFDLDGTDNGAFYGLYAGLRMFMEYMGSLSDNPKTFSLTAAENYCRLQELKEKHPKKYAEAEDEYNANYGLKADIKVVRLIPFEDLA